MLLQLPLALLPCVHPKERTRETDNDGTEDTSDSTTHDGGLTLLFAAVVRDWSGGGIEWRAC